MPSYNDTVNILKDRIKVLINDNPEILQIDDPWKLFDFEALVVSDLDPSLFQAQWALSRAKQEWRQTHG